MNIFVLGATGYIGGTVAERLRQLGHRVSGLARTEAKAVALRERGIEPVVGTLDDDAVLAAAASAADAVVNAASSDHRAAVDTLVRALAGSGKKLIHTSGSSIVSTDARGEPTDAIYDEETSFEPIAERVARVALDRALLDSANQGVHPIVICPTQIYGHGLGLHRDSVQIPMMIEEAKSSGVAHFIERGENVWSNVHIEDLGDLYLLALEKAPKGAFYFAENGEGSMRQVAEAIGRKFGLPAASFSFEQAAKVWGEKSARLSLGSNSRVRSKRARAELGWRPHRPSAFDWIAS